MDYVKLATCYYRRPRRLGRVWRDRASRAGSGRGVGAAGAVAVGRGAVGGDPGQGDPGRTRGPGVAGAVSGPAGASVGGAGPPGRVMTGGPESVCAVPAVPFHPPGHSDRPTAALGTGTAVPSPGPELAGLGSLVAWLAATLAAAPGGTVGRQHLRDAAPYLGQERWTDGHRARRHQAGGTAGTSRGRRSTSWLRKLLAELERDGIVQRDGAAVTVLDRAGLAAWAEHWTRPHA